MCGFMLGINEGLNVCNRMGTLKVGQCPRKGLINDSKALFDISSLSPRSARMNEG